MCRFEQPFVASPCRMSDASNTAQDATPTTLDATSTMKEKTMRKVLGIFTLILVSALVAFPQVRDDHDDNGPVLSGYAVITPSAPTNAMVVFETFGLRRTAETTQAGVLPADLTTNAVMFVSSSGRLGRNLGVAIVNPNSASVNVTLTLRRDDGTQAATTTLAIPALNQTSRFVTELFAGQPAVASDFMGTMSLVSSAPIAAIGLRFRGLNFSTLPITSLSAGSAVPIIAPGVGGTGAVLLPQFAANGGWASQIIVGNTGTTALTVRADLFGRDGTALRGTLNGVTSAAFTNIVIPPGGVVSLAPRNTLGDDDF
jgi:hypothetical protein